MLQPVVSVVIPARDEEATVGAIVESLVGLDGRICEVLVVDDESTDATAEVATSAGARVISSADVLSEYAPGPGKGQAMWKGLAESLGEIVVFCDADLVDFDPAYATGLVAALERKPGAALAKGRYARSGTGGRVNELVARPALELLYPGLSRIAQPLGGEYAAWRDVLERVPFVYGYGVDLGLLIDIASRFGPQSIVQAGLGVRTHRNRSLEQLRPQARTVLEVALHRAGLATTMDLDECPPLAEVAGYERATA